MRMTLLGVIQPFLPLAQLQLLLGSVQSTLKLELLIVTREQSVRS